MTPAHTNTQTDYRPRLEEEHADDRGAGINNEMWETGGLSGGVGLRLPAQR